VGTSWGLHYKSLTIVIYDRNDITIVIYDCNGTGHYYQTMFIANCVLNKLVHSHYRPSQHSLMFVGKARSLPYGGAPLG